MRRLLKKVHETTAKSDPKMHESEEKSDIQEIQVF